LKYARARRANLEIFLGDPEVPIDTNHLERSLRPIPMGKNYGQFAIMQSCAEINCHIVQ
jgi:transposase